MEPISRLYALIDDKEGQPFAQPHPNAPRRIDMNALCVMCTGRKYVNKIVFYGNIKI